MKSEPKIKDICDYDIRELSLFQIECKIEQLHNAAAFYMDKLEYIKSFERPRSSQLKEIMAHGGDATSPYDKYLTKIQEAEENDYINKLRDLKTEIKLLKNYLERQKEIISKYDDKKQKIIYLKEKGNTWLYIANKVNYSIRQCQRIYNEYADTRKKD